MTLDRMKLSAQTVRDNIAILEEVKQPDDAGYYLQLEHEKFVLECVEKQIPKKVTHEASLYSCCTCPDCKNVIDEFTEFAGKTARVTVQYCKFCGQALDWSDIE